MKICPSCHSPLFTHLDTITHDEMHARRGIVSPGKRGDGKAKAPPASVQPGGNTDVISVTTGATNTTRAKHCSTCRCSTVSNAERQRAYRERKRIDTTHKK